MDLLLFILSGFGVTTIITKSRILAPFRNYLDNNMDCLKKNFLGLLIICPMCVGFWVGVFQSIIVYSPNSSQFFTESLTTGFLDNIIFLLNKIVAIILDGAIIGVLSWVVHTIISFIDKSYDFIDTKDLYYQFLIHSVEEDNKKKEQESIQKEIL